MDVDDSRRYTIAWCGRIGGPLLAIAVAVWLGGGTDGLSVSAGRTAAIGTLMAVFWMTEALPLPVTSLLPLVLFPLTGVLPLDQTAAPYAHPIIFLFMGGFMMALAIERWDLHHRMALLTVLAMGTDRRRLVGGFMVATALLSMWISNTATTVMMLPIGLSIVAMVGHRPQPDGGVRSRSGSDSGRDDTPRLAACLLLGIAYAANIGGVGTLVGTPPNIVLAGFLKSTYGIELGFGRWMVLGLPLVGIFGFVAWLVLTRIVFALPPGEIEGGRDLIREEVRKLGPMSRGEWTVLALFSATALAWALREPLARWEWLVSHVPIVADLNDTIIAMVAAILLFAIPVDLGRGKFVLDWETARMLPWGILLLFGGGLSLAAAIQSSGLAESIGMQFRAFDHLPLFLVIVLTTTGIIFLTEVTSNTATATTFLPILGGLAVGIGADPVLITVPAALAASCAFMMPVATPPNAIVFASGHISMGQMIRAGLWLNLIGALLIPAIAWTVGRHVFQFAP